MNTDNSVTLCMLANCGQSYRDASDYHSHFVFLGARYGNLVNKGRKTIITEN